MGGVILVAPKAVYVRQVESSIERACTKYATDNGVMPLKLVKFSGIPDKAFLYSGAVIFVEFKTQVGVVRPLQAYTHKQLRSLGFKVYVIRSLTEFKEVIGNEFSINT